MAELELSTTHTEIARHADPGVAIALVLERIGWRLVHLDLDLSQETGCMAIRRESLEVTLAADNLGRGSITRELVERVTHVIGRRGDRFRAERFRTTFLGRTRVAGLRSGLRVLCNYIADNSEADRIKIRRDVSNALLLSAPPTDKKEAALSAACERIREMEASRVAGEGWNESTPNRKTASDQ